MGWDRGLRRRALLQPQESSGIERTLALVRAFAARVGVRVVDRGSRRDPYQAGAQAENRSAGRPAAAAVAVRESLISTAKG